jgi:hypothetical protein
VNLLFGDKIESQAAIFYCLIAGMLLIWFNGDMCDTEQYKGDTENRGDVSGYFFPFGLRLQYNHTRDELAMDIAVITISSTNDSNIKYMQSASQLHSSFS